MGGSDGGAGHAFVGGWVGDCRRVCACAGRAESGPQDIDPGGSKFGLDEAGTAVTAAGVDIDSAGVVIISTDCDGISGISRAGDDRVRIRAEEDCVIGNQTTARKPYMEGIR